MKSESELNADIFKITLAIQARFPELSKYLDEMPVTIPNMAHPHINPDILKDYYDSLEILMSDYALNHNLSK